MKINLQTHNAEAFPVSVRVLGTAAQANVDTHREEMPPLLEDFRTCAEHATSGWILRRQISRNKGSATSNVT